MPRDPFNGRCSRCSRIIDVSKEPSTLGGLDPASGRLTQRICDECAERERRQKAGACSLCGNAIENPDGAEGAICSNCYARYLSTNWEAIDAACLTAEAAHSHSPIQEAIERLESVQQKKLATVRVNTMLHGNALVVRQIGRRT
jgi:NMD protein affecting ribosome stability and mRNA decay